MVEALNQYGYVYGDNLTVIIAARGVLIGDPRWWCVKTLTGQFYFDDTVGRSGHQWYRWTIGQDWRGHAF